MSTADRERSVERKSTVSIPFDLRLERRVLAIVLREAATDERLAAVDATAISAVVLMTVEATLADPLAAEAIVGRIDR